MTGSTQDTTSTAEPSQAWDAAQYEAALAHLEQLQERLDNLRSVIPSIVAPLAKPAASKAQTFAQVGKAAGQSTDDLKAFREKWTSEQTQAMFARGRDSLEKDGDLSKAAQVASYGWVQQ